MKVDVEALTFRLTPAQRSYVEKRIDGALGVYAMQIENVEVWLSEFRVHDGNLRKRCLVWVELAGERTVVSESTDPDLRVAIYRAADRAGWKVARNVMRSAWVYSKAGAVDNLPLPPLDMTTADRPARHNAA